MPVKGAAITVQYVAWNTSTNVGQTGDAANHAIRAVGDGNEFTPAAAPVQVDATNMPGVYKIAIAAAENNYDLVTLGGKSATANIALLPITWTNTASVPQTGDSYARMGANGAGLTSVGLGAAGLDQIPVTDPGGVATTFPRMMVQVWRLWFRRSTKTTADQSIRTYADDGITVRTSQGYTDDGAGNQTRGAAS
jgi:hypothetical protein